MVGWREKLDNIRPRDCLLCSFIRDFSKVLDSLGLAKMNQDF
jgi:hypothetical protein